MSTGTPAVLDRLQSWNRRARDDATTWFAGRTARERVILALGALVVGAGLFVVLVWRPLDAARADALARITILERLTVQATSLNSGEIGPTATAPAVAPATAVTNTAAEYGLTIRRLESEGILTRVSLEDVKFDTLLLWLEGLEQSAGLHASSVELERRPEPGVVSARLALEP